MEIGGRGTLQFRSRSRENRRPVNFQLASLLETLFVEGNSLSTVWLSLRLIRTRSNERDAQELNGRKGVCARGHHQRLKSSRTICTGASRACASH